MCPEVQDYWGNINTQAIWHDTCVYNASIAPIKGRGSTSLYTRFLRMYSRLSTAGSAESIAQSTNFKTMIPGYLKKIHL